MRVELSPCREISENGGLRCDLSCRVVCCLQQHFAKLFALLTSGRSGGRETDAVEQSLEAWIRS